MKSYASFRYTLFLIYSNAEAKNFPHAWLKFLEKTLYLITKNINSVMAKIGIGKVMHQMKQQIEQIKAELVELGEPESMPEMIENTNLIRSNEHLSKTNQKKSELLIAYDEYSKQLENLLSSVFEIQNELKEILKDQSNLISTPKKSKKQSKKKSSK